MKKIRNTTQQLIDEDSKGVSLSDQEYVAMLGMFKAISEETRLRIICLLEQETLCVSDLARTLKMTNSAVSHQLSYLKKGNIVKAKKIGKRVFYQLSDACIRDIVQLALHHIRE